MTSDDEKNAQGIIRRGLARSRSGAVRYALTVASAALESDRRLGAIEERLVAIERALRGDDKSFEAEIAEARQHASAKFPFTDISAPGFYEAVFVPTEFDQSRFTLEGLWTAALRASVNHRGWPFLYVDPHRHDTYATNEGLETMVATKSDVAAEIGDYHYDFWQVRRSGLLFLRVLMREEMFRSQQGGRFVGVWEVQAFVTQAIECLGRLYSALRIPDTENIELRLQFQGLEGRPLRVLEGRVPIMSRPKVNSDRIDMRIRKPLKEWQFSYVDHAADILVEAFSRMNWANAPRQIFVSDAAALLGGNP